METTPFTSVYVINMATTGEFSSKVLEACEAGEVFIKEFYTTIDKRRNVMSSLINI